MQPIEAGRKLQIISYKHNGELHRVWQHAIMIKEFDDFAVLVNDRANVIDSDGRKWKTREPAVCYFFKEHWFNVICMIRGNDIYYYCNLSSPYVIDEEGLKYIDYDLDVKLFPSGDSVILDRDEFDFNKIDYHYSQDLIEVIEKSLERILIMIVNKQEPFDKQYIMKWYEVYKNTLK
jgi:protein associated with RNAse G/E